MGSDEIYEKSTEPKETNRQIGRQFTRWIKTGTLAVPLINQDEFIATKSDVILNASDNNMKNFANENLGYTRKGLEFIAHFNGIYVIGEAKFLTDFSGHQNAQFADAMDIL